jgi:hypothetical protein
VLTIIFADADIADRAQNPGSLNKNKETLNSSSSAEAMEKIRLHIVKGYLQRQSRKNSPPRSEPPLFTRNANFTIRH